MPYIGRATRHYYNNYTERENPTFLFFLQNNEIEFHSQYRQIDANVKAEYISFSKYNSPLSYKPHTPCLTFACKFLYTTFFPYLYGSTETPLPIVLQELNKQTSPGWPFTMQFSKKKDAIQDFPQILNMYWHLLKTHLPVPTVWTLTVKQELRPLEKHVKYGAEQDNFRVFTAGPLERIASGNRMFLDQNNRLYDAAGRTPSEVGSSKFYGGFARILGKFKNHPCAWSLDLKGFDSTQSEDLHYRVRDFRISMFQRLTHDQVTIIHNLYRTLVHGIIITTQGELIQKNRGNCSGGDNTISDNGYIALICIFYAWIRCFMEQFPNQTPKLKFCEETLAIAIIGDNIFIGTKPEHVVWLNARLIYQYALELALTITTDNWEYDLPENLEFCSMKFGTIDGLIVPVPETNKVLSSLMYGSKYQDTRIDLMRAYALRIESWANLECREIISKYIDFLLNKYREELVGDAKLGDVTITMKQIHSMMKSDRELYSIYTGRELGSAGNVDLPDPNLINFVSLSTDTLLW